MQFLIRIMNNIKKMKSDNKNNPPGWLEFLLKLFVPEEEFYEKLGDYSEAYNYLVQHKGKFIATIYYLQQLLLGIPVFIKNTLCWGTIMFKHYFKISVRNFTRQKLYSFINVLGLAVGLAACLIILFWVQDELSYDKFNKNYDNIVRISRQLNYENRDVNIPITSYPYGPTMVNEFPEVINSVHFVRNDLFILDKRNVFNRQQVFHTDNSVFEIFDFKLISGDVKNALKEPATLVITREFAMKYFGTTDVVGKTLSVQDDDGGLSDWKIDGVLEDVPANSHIQFKALASFAGFSEDRLTRWAGNWLYTYLLLQPGTDIETLKSKFPPFIDKYLAPEVAPYLPPNKKITDLMKLNLQPLKNIHLQPSEYFEIQPQGSLTYVYVFSAIALLILFIACMNFMNLSSARAGKRAKEVGLRKAVGAHRKQLWKQFIGESIMTSFSALILAIVLILIFLPGFNTIAGKELSANILLQNNNWIYLLGVTILTGILAGFYPAFILSSFDPAKVFKNEKTRGGRAYFRKVTTIFQFVISIALIICTLIVYNQMQFLKNKALGFDKDNVVLIEAEGNDIVNGMEEFRNRLEENSQIKSVSASTNYPGNSRYSDTMFEVAETGAKKSMMFLTVDYDFINTYGFKMISGRNFSRQFSTDADGGIIMNEAAVKKLELDPETAIGKKIIGNGDFLPFHNYTIVGVVKDYHFRSLHEQITPCLFLLTPDRINYISVKIGSGRIDNAVSSIENTWREVFPKKEFNFSFLDERIQGLYDKEQRMGTIIMIFSIFSIFVACLGLFGLASYTAEEKTKEIGIRKVLGSSVFEIVVLIIKRFVLWIALANLIAWPAAYYLMDDWLQNFAFRADLNYGLFILSTGITLLIAIITVGFQSLKAAYTNPVKSLKQE